MLANVSNFAQLEAQRSLYSESWMNNGAAAAHLKREKSSLLNTEIEISILAILPHTTLNYGFKYL